MARIDAHCTSKSTLVTLISQALEDFPDSPFCAHLQTDLSQTCLKSGDIAQCRELLELANQSEAASTEPWLRARILTYFANLAMHQANTEEAQGFLDAAEEAIEQNRVFEQKLYLKTMHAKLELRTGRIASANKTFHRLLERHGPNLSAPLHAHLSALLATSSILTGDTRQALTHIRTARTQLTKKGREYADLLSLEGWCLAEIGQFEEGISLAKQAFHLACHQGDPFTEAFMMGRLVQCSLAASDPDEVVYWAQEAVDVYRNLNVTTPLGIQLANLGIARRMQGQLESARAHLEEAMSILGDDAHSQAIGLTHLVAIVAKSDLASATTLLKQCKDYADATGLAYYQQWVTIGELEIQIARLHQGESPKDTESFKALEERIEHLKQDDSKTHLDYRIAVDLLQKALSAAR